MEVITSNSSQECISPSDCEVGFGQAPPSKAYETLIPHKCDLLFSILSLIIPLLLKRVFEVVQAEEDD